MSKRKNPFETDGSPLMFKTFVDKKVINEFSCSSDRNMQQVYEKTNQLLWMGAKTCALGSTWKESSNEQFHKIAPLSAPVNQMQIDSHGHLCRMDTRTMDLDTSPAIQSDRDLSSVEQRRSSRSDTKCKNGRLCVTCRSSVPSCDDAQQINCAWCSSSICSGCVRLCHTCQNLFCHVCAIMNYSECNERSFCLQCTGSGL